MKAPTTFCHSLISVHDRLEIAKPKYLMCVRVCVCLRACVYVRACTCVCVYIQFLITNKKKKTLCGGVSASPVGKIALGFHNNRQNDYGRLLQEEEEERQIRESNNLFYS